MKTFKSSYDFYRLSEEDRIALIGMCFKQEKHPTLYFPVQLAAGEFNYGCPQGLIFVTDLRPSDHGKWFRVGAHSPDDLDRDLDFTGHEIKLRGKVIKYIMKVDKSKVTYRGLLKNIQEHFGAGTITS